MIFIIINNFPFKKFCKFLIDRHSKKNNNKFTGIKRVSMIAIGFDSAKMQMVGFPQIFFDL